MGTLNRLTVAKVKSLQNIGKRGRWADGGGLYLVINAQGNINWSYLYMRHKVRREIGLGGEIITLKEARQRAEIVRQAIRDGEDPKKTLNPEKPRTFFDAVEGKLSSLDLDQGNAKNKYQWERTAYTHCKSLHAIPIEDITTEDILRVIKPIWKKTPETGRRTRARIEAIIDYAKAKGWRSNDNPARWKGHLKEILPKHRDKVVHYPSLPYSEMPAFMTMLDQRIQNHGGVSLSLMKFVILTAVRTGEARFSTWGEFDLTKALWSIPGERMKTGNPHTVPLTAAAVDVINAQKLGHDYLPNPKDYVFKSSKPKTPLSNMAMLTALKRMDRSDITVHGFRSTFRDWAGDRTTFAREVAEAALSHTVGDAVERSYRRSDALEKRRALMNAWAEYCAGKDSDVIRLFS